jgi:hypothetical protein
MAAWYWKAAFGVLRNGLPNYPAVPVTAPTELEIKEVIGKAATVTLYCWREDTGKTRFESKLGYPFEVPVYEENFAHTCEQAHKAANGKQVHAVKCIRVGRSYFRTEDMKSLKVLPKPRVNA